MEARVMSFFETVKTSERLRNNVSGYWLLFCLACGVGVLHFGTDFEIHSLDWWRYLIDVIRFEHRLPLPYAWIVPGTVIAYYSGIIFGKISFKRTDYGDAKPANPRDFKQMELDGSRNIIIGHIGNKPIIPRHDRHAIVVAGTRSGKTQGIGVPTLLNYQGSAVVIDPKGELWDMTSGHRSTFSDCYRLEWTAEDTARYNPISLKVMPETPAQIELRVNQIANILAPEAKDYWTKDAQKALRALMLLEIFDAKHEGRDAKLENVAHFSGALDGIEADDLSQENKTSPILDKLFRAAQRARKRGYPRSCETDLGDLATMAPNQSSGVFGTLAAEIQVLKTAAVANAIGGCDIDPKMLVEGERPVTIYIVVRPRDSGFTSILTTTLITNFVLDLVSRTSAEAENHHSVLFILEEFSAMKKTPAIGELLDRGAGLGVHGLIVIQSFSQVRDIYSEDELKTFINNADYLIIFAVTDADTQAWLEKLVGKTTRRRESRSHADKGHDSSSMSYEGVPLILAQEWGEIPFGEHRILVRYHTTRPIFAKTGFAYKDSKSAAQMKISPPPVRIAANDDLHERPFGEITPEDEAE
jgi:type IV secretion system protein VirD4